MKIELKNVKHHHRLSEESLAFTADVYVDGIKMGQAKNRGNGGTTDIIPYSGKRELYDQAIKFGANLPTDKSDGDTYIQPTLDSLIDQLVENDLIAKDNAAFEAKLKKATLSSICFGKEDRKQYKTLTLPMPIKDLLLQKNGKAYLLKRIAMVKDYMQPGEIIFNDNIPKEFL